LAVNSARTRLKEQPETIIQIVGLVVIAGPIAFLVVNRKEHVKG